MTENHRFLAPDNGVLTLVSEVEEIRTVYHLTSSHYFREPVSETFHGRDVFAAQTPEIERLPESEREIEVGLFQLIEAYRDVLQRTRDGATCHDITIETLTVRDRMMVVMRVLEARGSIDFESIFLECDKRAPSRLMVVTTFLAVLELARIAALRVYQGRSDLGVPAGPIHVRLAASDRSRTNP